MTGLRIEVDLDAVTHNTRTLVDLLAPSGIAVTGVTKAALGWPALAAAMLAGGAAGLGDSRVENVATLRAGGVHAPITLIRSPMPSQAPEVVALADTSCNTELAVLEALSAAAVASDTVHAVLLMVELGDLREGVGADEVVHLARRTAALPHLSLAGLGTNLACQSGVAPDGDNMGELSRLADLVEREVGVTLSTVSGGNSANLAWALDGADVGRIDDLRLGEAILLGVEPLHRTTLPGLRTDAVRLVAEVIEAKRKPSLPWGTIGQTAFGPPPVAVDRGQVHRALIAVGRQDVDPLGLAAPEGVTVVGASSDHLVVESEQGAVAVGDELSFGLDYGALVRAMTSPFVARVSVRTSTALG